MIFAVARARSLIVLSLACGVLRAAAPAETPAPNLTWVDVRTLGLEGSGWTDKASFYDRLPARAKGVVRDVVWDLSHNSAGLCVHFETDASELRAEWTLTSANLALPNMDQNGVSGLDLYVRTPEGWRWMGSAGARKREGNAGTLFSGVERVRREFLLYLPLYNGIESLRLGIPPGCSLESRVRTAKPVVIYGTSIVEGGCVSRPGMAYPAKLGQRLDLPVINLGFSGNAHAEPEVAALVAEIDAALFVLDPLPNLTSQEVARVEPFVATLRAKHPATPIVLVQNLEYPDGAFIPMRRAAYEASNRNLQAIFERLRRSDPNLHMLPAAGLIGDDGEATVDGVHPTDLGVMRMVERMVPVLKAALAGPGATP